MGLITRKKDTWIVAAAVVAFALWKLLSLHFRFGDENVYFYMSDAILRGAVPYKDFFLADPPFFVYFLAGFKALIGSHPMFFKVIPVLFDSLSAVLIYLILHKRDNAFAALAPVLYLFSFTVLSTSDYVTGAEVMIFLMLLAIYLDQREKHFLSGVFWALACLCKLYAGPALLGFLLYKLIAKEFKPAGKIVLGGLAATAVVLAPFLTFFPHQTFYDLVIHQFNRPIGIDKWSIWSVFAGFEWLLILSSVVGMFITKNRRWALPLIFSAAFFLLYRDLYYLYLHLMLPFMVILTVEAVAFLDEKGKGHEVKPAWAFIAIYAVASIYPIYSYLNVYGPQGVFDRPEEIATALKSAPGDLPVYGAQEVAPLVALMSGRKIFDNVIDTNTQNFAAGSQDLGQVSKKAVENGVYLVARVADYPNQNVSGVGFEGYFDAKIWKDSCQLYRSFDRTSPGDPLNKVVIYRCD